MATPTEQTDFGAPFDYTDGDVYLRSVDGARFRVHKLQLSTASVTFRELFASGNADTQRHSIPVVPLLASEEDKAAIAAFLQIVYPVAFPSLQGIPSSDACSSSDGSTRPRMSSTHTSKAFYSNILT
jgi:hypothetical protein